MSRLERTHWWYRSTHELVKHCIHKFVGIGSSIFDAGCGTGGLLRMLSSSGEVSGCDTNYISVRLARKNLKSVNHSCIQQIDIEELSNLESRTFDCVTCIDVLYHQRVGHWRAALESLKRLLKPRGHLILQVPAFSALHGSHDVALDGARRFRRAEIESALEQSGLITRLCTYRYSHIFFLLLARRFVSRFGRLDRQPISDFETPCHMPSSLAKRLDQLALRLARIENLAVLNGAYMPLGSSLFAVARRP